MTQTVYIGPSFATPRLRQFTVFVNELPAALTPLLDKTPAIKGLFVPLDDFARAKAALNVKNSPEAILFTIIKNG